MNIQEPPRERRAGRGTRGRRRGLPPLPAVGEIITAIRKLRTRGGSPFAEIAKYLKAKGVAVKRTALELALKKGVADGQLKKNQQSFVAVVPGGGGKRPKTRKNRRKKKPSPKRKRRKKRQISKKRRFSRKRKRKWRKTKKKY